MYLYVYACIAVPRVSLARKLRLFEFNFVSVPVRTASDQPYRLQKFRLRLFYASDVRQPNLEVNDMNSKPA